jgi:hypothetical protein
MILYGDIDEVPLTVVDDYTGTKPGVPYEEMDEEQIIRTAIAATIIRMTDANSRD